MYAIPTVIFAHYKHRQWKTINMSHYHSAQILTASRLLTLEIFANLPVYCIHPVFYFARNLPASPFIPHSLSICLFFAKFYTEFSRQILLKSKNAKQNFLELFIIDIITDFT